MKKSSLLSQLAVAGIAAGLVSTSALADAAYNAKPTTDSTMKPAAAAPADTGKGSKKKKAKHAPAKKEGAAMDSTKAAAPADSSKGEKAAVAGTAKHDCKGLNSCKGQGGCKSSKNGCKGKNDCKGQGGCKTT